MNVHGALDHRIRRLGVHHIEDRMNNLIAFDAQERRAEDLFGPGVDHNFHESLRLALLHRAADAVIVRFAIKALRPDFRASVSVIPALPSGGSMYRL